MGANVLIVGGGGREHALAWQLQHSPQVNHIFMTAHNFATAKFTQIAPSATAELCDFCRQHSVELALIGPEVPLAAGLADCLRAANIAVLGPSKAAAQIESSKIYAKELMRAAHIRTADFVVCDSIAEAKHWINHHRPPYVIKADGLAAGKGVLICDTAAAALPAATAMLRGQFGAASKRILLEEHLSGRELSFIVLTDGKKALPLATCRDYKRLCDGDNGPNTGGMGAYSPVPEGESLRARIMDEVMFPALRQMEKCGAPFCGFLYAGLMIDDNGAVSVLEFNCRLGDPETQVILPRLQGDCYPTWLAAAQGDLRAHQLTWRAQTAVNIVLAAAGYPHNPRGGDRITLPPERADVLIFHAGTTADKDGKATTCGGRVLSVVGLGDELQTAKQHAEDVVRTIHFDGMHCRRDIGGNFGGSE